MPHQRALMETCGQLYLETHALPYNLSPIYIVSMFSQGAQFPGVKALRVTYDMNYVGHERTLKATTSLFPGLTRLYIRVTLSDSKPDSMMVYHPDHYDWWHYNSYEEWRKYTTYISTQEGEETARRALGSFENGVKFEYVRG
jgi:hypothetical protein